MTASHSEAGEAKVWFRLRVTHAYDPQVRTSDLIRLRLGVSASHAGVTIREVGDTLVVYSRRSESMATLAKLRLGIEFLDPLFFNYTQFDNDSGDDGLSGSILFLHDGDADENGFVNASAALRIPLRRESELEADSEIRVEDGAPAELR